MLLSDSEIYAVVFSCSANYGHIFAALQDPAKAKQFFPFLQRAGKTIALVEVRLVLHDHIRSLCLQCFTGNFCP